MNSKNLALERLTTLQDIERLVPDWNGLISEDQMETFFRSPYWYLSWLRNIRRDVTPLLFVVRSEERVVAIAPFCIGRQGRWLRVVSLAGSDVVCGEYLGIVALPEFRAVALERIWAALIHGQSDWDMVSLTSLPAEGDLYWEARNCFAQNRLMIRSDERICPFVALPSSFDEYLGRLSRKRRKHFSRAMRVFNERGVEIKTYINPQDLPKAIDRLIDLHTVRWKMLGKPGTLGEPGFREFLKGLAASQGRLGLFRIYTLEVNGIARAALLNFHSRHTALQFQNGFDPHWELAPHSPGTVLVLHAIKQAIAEGLRGYDFLRGAEDYKFQFADRCKLTTNISLARSWKARAYLLARDFRAALRKRSRGARGKQASPGIHEWIFVSD